MPSIRVSMVLTLVCLEACALSVRPDRLLDAAMDGRPPSQLADAVSPVDAIDPIARCPEPRPIAPLSAVNVTSQRPMLRWALPPGSDGARVEVCRDRACTDVITRFDVTGSAAAPEAPLAAGVRFWRLFARSAGTVCETPSATWQFTVGARNAPVDRSWGAIPDVNGDGFADAIIGAPRTGRGVGRLHIYYGGPGGLPAAPSTSRAATDPPRTSVGESVASAGDVNGDGFADVVVFARRALDGVRQVDVYHGGAGGLADVPAASASAASAQEHSFGIEVAGAGDVNGDGYADVMVGSPGDSRGTGRVYLYLGGEAGLAAVPAATLVGRGAPTPYFGGSITSAGDVNGDGFGDVLIGAAGFGRRPGYVDLYLGSAGAFVTTPALTLTAPEGTPDEFGSSVACAGDLDGDGFPDVLVGAPRARRVYVYAGSAAGLSPTASATLLGQVTGTSVFGIAVASAGDTNGDGLADAVVGDRNGRQAWVYLGSERGLPATPPASITPNEGVNWSGLTLVGGGDTNGDGFAEVIVGLPLAEAGTGIAYVCPGSAAGLSPMRVSTLRAPQPGGSFGASIASVRAIRALRLTASPGPYRAAPIPQATLAL